MSRLEGRRALVTGAGSGIGAEIAARFEAQGARVVGADLQGAAVEMDVRSKASVDAGVAAAVDRLGGLDCLVANAGKPVVGTILDLSEEQWDDGVSTNLKSIYLCAKAAWPHLVESRGSISITASVVGLWASQNQAAYCAAKAGAVMLAKCLALDGAKAGVRANAVCPGFIRTPMLDRFFAAQADPAAAAAGAAGLHPLGTLGEPSDIAEAFVYLASDEAKWVTGTILTVDGGLTSGIWGG